MTVNKWLGKAQPKVAQKAFFPSNISPGCVFSMRVGSQNFSYVYPRSELDSYRTDQEKAQVVCNGLVEAYSSLSGLIGGGSAGSVESIEAALIGGKWAVYTEGLSTGAPINVELSASESSSSIVRVTELQDGRAAQNDIQFIKWPGTPTAGDLRVRFADEEAQVDFDATAAELETALEGLNSIGSGNVAVTGSYTAGYTVEFQGALAGQEQPLMEAFSINGVGVSGYQVEVVERGGIGKAVYTIAAGAMDGNSETIYRFYLPFPSAESYIVTGSMDADQIQDAIEGIEGVGAGNVAVAQNADGTITIELSGKYVGRTAPALTMRNVSTQVDVALTSSIPSSQNDTSTQIKITILNQPRLHGFKLNYNGTQTGVIGNVVGAGAIQAALEAANLDDEWTGELTAGSTTSYAAFEYTLTANYPNAIPGFRADSGIIIPSDFTSLGCYSISVLRIQSAKVARNGLQQVALLSDPDGGTFTLAFGGQTTAGLAYNAAAGAIQTAVQGLSSVGSGNALVSGPAGGPWLVEFAGTLGSQAVSLITGNGASLTISNAVTITTTDLQLPTGPNWWTNTANWSLGVVPDSDDIATFQNNAVDCIYGIAGVAALGGIDLYRSFTGRLGLPETRADGTPETLAQYLSLTDVGSKINIRIGLGDDGEGPSVVRINTGSQEADVSVIYSGSGDPTGSVYAIGLAGDLASVTIGQASVGLGLASGLTTTVDTLRLSPPADSQDAVVEWGEDCTVTVCVMSSGVLRAGSVPGALTATGGTVAVNGSGVNNRLTVRNTAVRWLAGGSLGQFGSITAFGLSGTEALLTSNGHGLSSGNVVFVRGIVGITGVPDGYYSIAVASANTFTLVGTAPDIPFGATDPTTESSYYQTGTAQWALADSVRIGVGGVLDFSGTASARTVVAPIVLQSPDAQVLDPNGTIQNMRLRSDNGFLDPAFGINTVFRRENIVAP